MYFEYLKPGTLILYIQNNEHVVKAIFVECNKPFWWIPKIEKKKHEKVNSIFVRVGWLLFSIGLLKITA